MVLSILSSGKWIVFLNLNSNTNLIISSNSYWVGLMGYSASDMNKAFAEVAKAGGTTLRTW